MTNYREYRFAVIRGKTSFYVRSIGHFRLTPESPEEIKVAEERRNLHPSSEFRLVLSARFSS